jgi:hypothetical protein
VETNTSYLLKIKLLGNRKKARKDVRCFSFDMVVDSDMSNYMDFVESVVDNIRQVIWKLLMFSTMIMF